MEESPQVAGRKLRNCDLYEKWLTTDPKIRHTVLNEFIRHYFDVDSAKWEEINTFVKYLCLDLDGKWKSVWRKRERFESRYENWLRLEVEIFKMDSSNVVKSIGRPQKSFSDSSMKTKKRRISGLLEKHRAEELQFAAASASSTLSTGQNKSFTPLEAFALMLDLNISVRKYKILRFAVNALHKNCFPSYYSLSQLKAELLPTDLTVDETFSEVNLQEILNNTVKSILKTLEINQSRSMILNCKWGFDGSSGHSLYKLPFDDNDSTDEFLFFVAFTPLSLIDKANSREIWVNPRPSSTLFCRPIKFIYLKENRDLVRTEEKRMQEYISQLNKFYFEINGETVNVEYCLHFTMVDGSVTNILTETNSPSKCFICGARPVEMNQESVISKIPRVENYKFGLSILHSWIRFYECLLHIAYRLPLKQWQVRSDQNKKILEERKKVLQAEFKKRMGLIVDKPRAGSGTSNDGNSARRFFSSPELSSDITGIDKTLIFNFGLILRIISIGYKINISEFDTLLLETKNIYMSLYSWYYMPSSVHKVLIHGSAVISFFDLPIGVLSEEALEARHKEIRKIRLDHTRKNSRINSNQDLMSRLLLTSDPLLFSKRKIIRKSSHHSEGDISKYVLVPKDEEETESVLNIENLSLSDENSTESDSD